MTGPGRSAVLTGRVLTTHHAAYPSLRTLHKASDCFACPQSRGVSQTVAGPAERVLTEARTGLSSRLVHASRVVSTTDSANHHRLDHNTVAASPFFPPAPRQASADPSPSTPVSKTPVCGRLPALIAAILSHSDTEMVSVQPTLGAFCRYNSGRDQNTSEAATALSQNGVLIVGATGTTARSK